MILKKDSMKIRGEEKRLETDFSMKILISDVSPRALVDRELGKVSLELQSMGNVQDFICLADISLLRTEGAYIIENIEEKSVKKYIEAPAQSVERSEYLDFFRGTERLGSGMRQDMPLDLSVQNDFFSENKLQLSTGTLEIPVGGKAKAGEVFYSGEVMHGLGAGAVYDGFRFVEGVGHGGLPLLHVGCCAVRIAQTYEHLLISIGALAILSRWFQLGAAGRRAAGSR